MSSNTGSKVGTGLFAVASVACIACAVAAFIMVGRVSATCDNKEQVDSAIQTIAYTTGGIIAFMTLLASSYVRAYPDTRDNYIFVLVHVALFLSLLGVSIGVISKRC
jgi:ABC-type phosphate transport system substrate-binding protein